MIDRTPDYLKALKSCRKENATAKKSSILTTRTMKLTTPFGKNSREIVTSITKLRDFLLENRKLYIGDVNDNMQMSDEERDKIDLDSEKCMKICSESLAALKQKEMPSNPVSQVNLHKKYTIELIEKYLKSVCRVYSEQRAIRVKKVVDKKRISRLQTETIANHSSAEKELIRKENVKPTYTNTLMYDSSDSELSPEDEAAFQQENQLLLHDMNNMVDEVKVIEGKVVEIARLQELFSEQVFRQEGEIEVVAEKIVESTENVKDGNEELREAIKNNAGFRVWILFFLVMCSFSLLFLEWYS